MRATRYTRLQTVYLPVLGMYGSIHTLAAHWCTVRTARGTLVTVRYASVVAR